MSFTPTIDSLGISSQNLIARNVEALGLGYSFDFLTKREFDKWKLAFKRTMIISHEYRNFIDLDYRHVLDYLLGAMIAKKQFTAEFDGTMPFSGRFGMSRIRANHLGAGDDWFSGTGAAFGIDGTATTASRANYVVHDNSTELGGGTDGGPVKILESAVFVIIGFGDLVSYIHGLESPVESWIYQVDGKNKPVIPYEHHASVGDFPIVELDEAIILKNKSTFELEFYAKTLAFPTAGNYICLPLVWGICYAPEAQMRVADPTNLDGTTNDMVTSTT
jgi:hypothetical protein